MGKTRKHVKRHNKRRGYTLKKKGGKSRSRSRSRSPVRARGRARSHSPEQFRCPSGVLDARGDDPDLYEIIGYGYVVFSAGRGNDRNRLNLYKTVNGRNCFVGYCDDEEKLDIIFAELEEGEGYRFNANDWTMIHPNL